MAGRKSHSKVPQDLNITPPRNSPVKFNSRSVRDWLESLNMLEYGPIFERYRSMEEVIQLTEGDLKDLGVRNGAHRARIASNIVLLRESQNRRGRSKTPCSDKSHSPGLTWSLDRRHRDAGPPSSVYQLMSCSTTVLSSPLGFAPPLSLGRDVAKNPWYHGSIPRSTAETLVTRNGEFLVRDSITQPGELVLTCCHNNVPLHFVINKLEHQNEKVSRYHFEDEAFLTVTELIQYYVRNCKPLTRSSDAVISIPVVSHQICPSTSVNKHNISNLEHRPKWTGSQPLLSVGNHSPIVMREPGLERRGSMPSMINKTFTPVEIVHEIAKPLLDYHRCGSEPLLTPTEDKTFIQQNIIHDLLPENLYKRDPLPEIPCNKPLPAPPKPSRVPTLKQVDSKPTVVIRNIALYDGDDSTDYNHLQQMSDAVDGVAIVPAVLNRNNASGEFPLKASSGLADFENMRSYFDDIINYDSSMLTPENKPLESSATAIMRPLLLQSSPQILAKHLTLVDIELFKIAGASDFGLGVSSGLELITLPQGHQLRQDIVERYHSLRLFVSVMILYCSSGSERASMLHQWIQIAAELRSVIGNLFGFSAIMDALCSTPISRLRITWSALKQTHASSYDLYETKLSSFSRSLNDASGTLPLQKIVIPHLFPLVELLERSVNGSEILSFPWELNSPTFGLDTLLIHLDTARVITEQPNLYRAVAERIILETELERCLLDLLCPQTHMKYIWGSRGVIACRNERLNKSEQLVNLLSEKVEPS